MILLLVAILLFILYSLFIFYYWKSWRSIPEYKIINSAPFTYISVIIPARNEAANIERLLKAITGQQYPKNLMQVIVVDDHSTDDTALMVAKFENIQLISLKEDTINSYKKKAIEKGIEAASGKLIVCTDADCLPGPKWLSVLADCYQKTGAVFIAAPVMFENNHSILQIFQSLDFLTLQGITGAAVHSHVHSMCNGANLAYERKAFYNVNGFDGIDHIASGDDMLLMHKIERQYPGKVQYLKSKEAIVLTQPMYTWKQFINQRIRWASKATYYNDKRILPVLLIVYLFNFLFLLLLIAGFWNGDYWIYFIVFWLAKTLIELPFILNVADFFNKKSLVLYFFFIQPIHIGYTILAGWLGQFRKYEWKGRKVK